MSDAEIVNLALSIHGAVLLAAIAAYYKYGDRTDLIDKSLRGTDEVLVKVRQLIADELGETLGAIFDEPATVEIVVAAGTYTELPGNPVGSEAYRDCIREFVETASNTMVDCRVLRSARDSWCFWARFLSWAILCLLMWELVSCGLIAVLDKAFGVAIPDHVVNLTMLPTVVGVVAVVFPFPFLLKYHDVISSFKVKYHGP